MSGESAITMHDWAASYGRYEKDPAALTMRDFEVFNEYGTAGFAAKAWDAHCQALRAAAPTPPRSKRAGVSYDAIADAIVMHAKRMIDPIKAEIATLKDTVAALEAAGASIRDRLLMLEAAVATKDGDHVR